VEVESKGRIYLLGPGQSVALAEEGPAPSKKPTFMGNIVAVSADGKVVTLESLPSKPPGEKTVRRAFKLTERTKSDYFGVPKDKQRPTVGYFRAIWLEDGNSENVALIRLGLKGRSLAGVVTAVSADGKTITVEVGKPGASKKVEIKIGPGSKVVYRDA